jgi:hypothetical protein
MEINQNSLCVCGHEKFIHSGWKDAPTGCGIVYAVPFGDLECWCTEFKLDNLSYIEQEAKKRNLV